MDRRERRKKGESLSDGNNNSRFAFNNEIDSAKKSNSISVISGHSTNNFHNRYGGLPQESSGFLSGQPERFSFRRG